jgi:hypothetical protein
LKKRTKKLLNALRGLEGFNGRCPVLQCRRLSDVEMPAALTFWLYGSASCEAPGRRFLVLFFKKEHPSLPYSGCA